MPFFCRILSFLGIVASTQGLWAQTLSLKESESIEMITPGVKVEHYGSKSEAPNTRPLVLKPSALLREKDLANTQALLPTYVQSDSIDDQPGEPTRLDGNVVLRRGNTLFKADHIQYSSLTDKLKAQGAVSLNKAGDLFRGTDLDIEIDSSVGFFIATDYQLLKNRAYGSAEKIDFIDDKQKVIHNATYTTCQAKPGPSWAPAWLLRADTLNLNSQTSIGKAEDARLELKDFPNVPLPSFSFPLTHERKSGFLPPMGGVDNVNGIQYGQPYYWNIAPNRDATITPTYWSKRGLDVSTEFRYLEGASGQERGQVFFNYLPNDQLRDNTNRWGYSQQHNGGASLSDPSMGKLAYSLNVNKVSDNLYWQDFPGGTGQLASQLLPEDFSATWSVQNLVTTVRTLKWQLLQVATTPITPPYDLLPELNSKYTLNNLNGFNLALEGDYSNYKSDRWYACQQGTTDCQPNAQRVYGLTKLSYPLINEYGYLTPKFMLHARSYDFDTPITATGSSTANVTVPTFSLDSGVTFERGLDLFGKAWTQTFEPRAFLAYTPFRNQNYLPVYDSSTYDFNYDSIFTENAFSGNDRISDTKMVAIGSASRLIDADNGFEYARLGIAQRIQLHDQDIYLPTNPVPTTGRFSDFLIGGTLNMNEKWKLDSAYEYNPQTSQSDLSSGNIRYSPTNYRLITAGFRFDRQLSANMLDMAWQWPINDLWGDKGVDNGPGRGLGENRWYTVARINYNKDTAQIGDAIVGLEYDAGCWLGRIALQRIQITSTTVNQSIMFQIEFDGFSKVGSTPFSLLKQTIPRYQNLRDPLADPSRYANY